MSYVLAVEHEGKRLGFWGQHAEVSSRGTMYLDEAKAKRVSAKLVELTGMAITPVPLVNVDPVPDY